MRFVAAAKTSLVFSASLAMAVLLSGQPSLATGTTVATVLCNSSSGSTAELSIATPANDSVISNGSVTISGTAKDVTQVNVTVDGNYDQTIAISAGQTTYSATVNLAQGTHTIEVTGNDICNVTDPTDSVVVSYVAPAAPVGGQSTPSSSPGKQPNIGPARPGIQQPVEGAGVDGGSWINKTPFIDVFAPTAVAVGRALDIDMAARDGVAKAFMRLVLLPIGVWLFLAGTRLITVLESNRMFWRVFKLGVVARFASRLKRNSWVVRALGLCLVLLALTI